MKITEDILSALYKAQLALETTGDYEDAIIIEGLRDAIYEKFDECL